LKQQLISPGFDCEIRFKNHLDNCWQAWFEGLQIENLSDGEVRVYGFVQDQSALFGLLNKIRDLNLRLIELNAKARKIN
jgi:hypothetical protein